MNMYEDGVHVDEETRNAIREDMLAGWVKVKDILTKVKRECSALEQLADTAIEEAEAGNIPLLKTLEDSSVSAAFCVPTVNEIMHLHACLIAIELTSGSLKETDESDTDKLPD